MTRRPPGWLEGLLNAGELHRLAVRVKSETELAQALGVTQNAYYQARLKATQAGRPFPSFEELRAGSGDDFADEAPTQPGVPDLGIPVLGDANAVLDAGNTRIPRNHFIKGVSTLRDHDGNVVMEWTKTNVHQQHYAEALYQAIADETTWLRGMADPIEPPQYNQEDLLTVYGIGDAHLGMFAWEEECGENFDLKIAMRDLTTAIDHLVELAPPSKHAIVLSVGDLVHFDNESKTTTAGTRQDADTRWSKVMRAAIVGGRHCTDRALEKHELVDDYWLSGNHDTHSSMAVSLALQAFYEREPRVRVSTSSAPFQYYRFGKVLLGFTHGHECKADKLQSVMACDRPRDWGETEFREWLTGHVHHLSVKEYEGCVVKTLRTLATKDRWHTGAGYRSGSEMVAITYHREFGLVDCKTVGLSQVRSLP